MVVVLNFLYRFLYEKVLFSHKRFKSGQFCFRGNMILSQGVVRAECLFPIPMSFVGVLKVTVNTLVTTIPSGSQRDNILKVRR